MSQNKTSKQSSKPRQKSSENVTTDSSKSLSNLSAIIATEKCDKKKKLHQLVLERIKGLKKRP